MVSLFKTCLAKDSIKHICSCVHSGHPAIRDEAANFLLNICSDFDDANSLLEIQKVPKPTDDGNEAEFSVNFFDEPHKSKKQIHKLFSLVKKHIISRAEYKQIIKQLNPDIHIIEEEELSLLKQEQKPIVTEPQEKATILVRVFGRKTSVLFDVQTLTDMFTADSQSDEMKEMIAQTIFISLATIKQSIVAN